MRPVKREPIPLAEPVTFICEAPASKKNRGSIIKVNGRPMILPNKQALRDEAEIRGILHARYGGGEAPRFADHDVEVRVQFEPRLNRCYVTVSPLRPRPKGFTGRRRDLANILEALLDALQGPLLANDNQVARIVIERDLR
jgi:hypothetical protein